MISVGKSKKDGNRFEDITSYSRPSSVRGGASHFFRYKVKPFFMRNKKRNLKMILSLCVCLVLTGVVCLGVYMQKMLGLIDYDPGFINNPDATFEDLEEDISYRSMHDITDADSLKGMLREWALNGGEKLHSKNVVNVLLLGCDYEDGTSRSDSMILVSVNRKTKKITLVSFLRDSYTYMDINGSERYDKTNHSYAWGGPATLIEILENNYKIEIDHYVSIDYASFIGVINELGGVRVKVTESEAKYMNRTTHFNDFQSGDSVLLDGERALIFCRIRYNDSEVERTRRQRDVITAIIKSTIGTSLGQLDNALETFLPYVKTNYRKSDIVSLGTQAISQQWMGYTIEHIVQPSEDFRREAYSNTWSKPHGSPLFIWVIDYPLAARELQTALYGTSNIEINEATHHSAFNLLSADYSPTYDSGNSSGGRDYDDDETTTRRSIVNWGDFGLGGNDDEDEAESTEPETYSFEPEIPSEEYTQEGIIPDMNLL